MTVHKGRRCQYADCNPTMDMAQDTLLGARLPQDRPPDRWWDNIIVVSGRLWMRLAQDRLTGHAKQEAYDDNDLVILHR